MSLLGPPEPYGPWVPAMPDCDRGDGSLSKVIAATLHRGDGALGRAAARRRAHLERRLEEGRWEAAEVRTALGLPMGATVPEVVAAIRALRDVRR